MKPHERGCFSAGMFAINYVIQKRGAEKAVHRDGVHKYRDYFQSKLQYIR